MNDAVVVTGMGVLAACGDGLAAVVTNVLAGRSGIGPLRSFDTAGMKMQYAGEVQEFDPYHYLPPLRVRNIDRASQLALVAAGDALRQAGLFPPGDTVIGVAVGVSGASQYQNWPVPLSRTCPVNRRIALYHSRIAPYFQATVLAGQYGLHGPQGTFSSASVGSALALGWALEVLRADKAEAMLAGGGEIQTLLNALGMDVLELAAADPCSPFSGAPGMTFGDGAAFVVLEPLAHARRRHASILGELVAYGVSADAYDAIANDPSGKGLSRAMTKALMKAGLEPADIGWIRASGTGHREQDIAEATAISMVFAAGQIPPVTSTEPFFGHVNGVSPILGLVTALGCEHRGVLPAIPGRQIPRAGCKLPLVEPGQPSPGGDFLLNAVAFGGNNATLVSGRYQPGRKRRRDAAAEPVITGMGVVSPFGCGYQPLLLGLRTGACGIGAIERFPLAPEIARRAGLVVDFQPLKLLPQLDLRRRERLVQYAMTAVGLALKDAGWNHRVAEPERIGLIVGLTRGPAGAYEHFLSRALRGEFDATTGRLLLKMGRFAVASELAHAFGLQGYCATVSHGLNGGLHTLVQGFEVLRQSADLDALLVVGADELSALYLRLFAALRLLLEPSQEGDERPAPYNPAAQGTVLGEGAVALLLERPTSAQARGARSYARLAGYGLTADALPRGGLDPSGRWLEQAIRLALQEAALAPTTLDLAVGHGCGWPAYDLREASALARILTGQPVCCVTGNTGLAESAGGLLSVTAALLGMQHGEAYPLAGDNPAAASLHFVTGAPQPGDYRHALVAGSTERGVNAAIVITRTDGAKDD